MCWRHTVLYTLAYDVTGFQLVVDTVHAYYLPFQRMQWECYTWFLKTQSTITHRCALPCTVVCYNACTLTQQCLSALGCYSKWHDAPTHNSWKVCTLQFKFVIFIELLIMCKKKYPVRVASSSSRCLDSIFDVLLRKWRGISHSHCASSFMLQLGSLNCLFSPLYFSWYNHRFPSSQ